LGRKNGVLCPSSNSQPTTDEGMSGVLVLRLPAVLAHREQACRAVSAVCKLSQSAIGRADLEAADRFTHELVSAVGETFNNVVLHAYAKTPPGMVELECHWDPERVVVQVRDMGQSFDFNAVPLPDLEVPHEKGMGVFIIRSFVDEVEYRAGPPNVLVLTKHAASSHRPKRAQRPGTPTAIWTRCDAGALEAAD
jgi:serine/threonine-protein kinase RsbW